MPEFLEPENDRRAFVVVRDERREHELEALADALEAHIDLDAPLSLTRAGAHPHRTLREAS